MNEDMGLERMLTTFMTDEVADRAPGRLVDDVLSATGRVRPAPRWLALLQEPPMRIASRVAVGIPARGLALAMVAAALLLLAFAAAIVGANLLKPPQPLAGDDWPMFHGDATRAGVAVTGPVGGEIRGHAQRGSIVTRKPASAAAVAPMVIRSFTPSARSATTSRAAATRRRTGCTCWTNRRSGCTWPMSSA